MIARPLQLMLAVALLLSACSGASTSVDASQGDPTPTASPTEPPTPAPTVTPEPTPTSTPTADPTPVPEPTPAAIDDCTRISDFDTDGWRIVNDGVMGGLSAGVASVADGVMTFAGTIITDGGGFSLVETALGGGELVGATFVRFRVRSDGRSYELIADDAESGPRVSHFGALVAAGTDWQEVDIPLDALEPRRFGTPADASPFRPDLATSIGIILSDGVDGDFELAIDWVDACR